MAVRVEAVGLEVGHIGINHSHSQQLLASFEGLYSQSDWDLAKIRFDNRPRRHLLAPERHSDIENGIAIRNNVRDDLHLYNALDLDLPAVFSPFAFSEESIDWFVQVTCFLLDWLIDPENISTFPIFEPPFHVWIVDVCVYLLPFQLFLQVSEPPLLLHLSAPEGAGIGFLQSRNFASFLFNLLQLHSSILDEDFSSLLKALVRELIEWDV